MANQLFVNPFPTGYDTARNTLIVDGSIVLAGSAVTTGEPINWTSILEGNGYNEINFAGNGIHGQASALTTGFAVSTGICTVTAANNFFAGQQVTFLGNTQTLSALFNGVVVTIASATSSNFTFATASTGTTTTSDVGVAVAYIPRPLPIPPSGATVTATVSALSASTTTLTVTAANTYLPGAVVYVNVATGTLGPKLAGLALPVISSTGTAFTATMPSALSGTTGTGTATGTNPATPFQISFWSSLDSGYTYTYNSTFGTLFVQVGGATASQPMANISAGAYPAGVLGDVIKYEAKFIRG
jgi:hypothetical protein